MQGPAVLTNLVGTSPAGFPRGGRDRGQRFPGSVPVPGGREALNSRECGARAEQRMWPLWKDRALLAGARMEGSLSPRPHQPSHSRCRQGARGLGPP